MLDDDRGLDKTTAVKRVLLHSGKIHWDLRAELDKNPNPEIALVRLEQFYPAPIDELNAVIDSYPNAQLFWVQDEPENQGAWPFIALEVVKHLHGRTIKPRLAGVRGIDGDRIAEGARDRAGRDHEEGADAVSLDVARQSRGIRCRRPPGAHAPHDRHDHCRDGQHERRAAASGSRARASRRTARPRCTAIHQPGVHRASSRTAATMPDA